MKAFKEIELKLDTKGIIKYIPLILFFVLTGLRSAQAQSCTVFGSSSVCINDQINYFVSGCSCTYTIVSVLGNPQISGSQITWNVPSGQYDILFRASGCSDIVKTIFVKSLPIAGTTVTPSTQTICYGLTASSIMISSSVGSISGWEKRTPGGSWSSIANTAGVNPLPSASIDNTQTYEYRMAVYQCSQTVYSSIAGVTVTPLNVAPPDPTNGNITTSCGMFDPIQISTNYPAGYTINHYYYNSIGSLVFTQTATNPFTNTVYVSQFTPSAFGGGSSTTFQLETEVVGMGGCAPVKSGRKTITYTLGSTPQPPASLTFLNNSSPVTSINACAGETINLTASGGTSNYNWYRPSGGAPISTSSSLSNFASENGIYTVIATWSNPCVGTSPVQGTFQVNVASPSLQILGPGPTFCKGSAQIFPSSISAGASNVSYNWMLNSVGSGSSSSFTLPASSVENNYTLNLSISADFAGQCQTRQNLSTSKSFQVLPAPNAPFVDGNTRFGSGVLTLTASQVFPLPSYFKWYTSAGVVQGNILNVSADHDLMNYLTVSAVGTNGCEGPTTNVSIYVFPLPTIDYQGAHYITLNGSTTLTTAMYDSYIWRNSAYVTLGTSQNLMVTQPDTYILSVSKSGAMATALIKVGDNISDPTINYLQEETVLKEGVVAESSINSLFIGERSQNIQYIDGLGRPFQTVVTQGSPLKKDIVQPIPYDVFGRQATKYLPYAASESTGRLKSNVFTSQAAFYNGTAKIPTDVRPYSEVIFESSPLNRPSVQFGTGQIWKDNNKSVTSQYLANADGEVLLFSYDAISGLIVWANTYYEAAQLIINKTIDEKQNDVIEYVDKEGRTICKKVQVSAGLADRVNQAHWASTYYIYDDLGNLVAVLPPEGVKALAP